MMEFDHPNVLKLRGVCLDGGPAPYIIMPYIANGSLLSYLQENKGNLVVSAEKKNANVRRAHIFRSSDSGQQVKI